MDQEQLHAIAKHIHEVLTPEKRDLIGREMHAIRLDIEEARRPDDQPWESLSDTQRTIYRLLGEHMWRLGYMARQAEIEPVISEAIENIWRL